MTFPGPWITPPAQWVDIPLVGTAPPSPLADPTYIQSVASDAIDALDGSSSLVFTNGVNPTLTGAAFDGVNYSLTQAHCWPNFDERSVYSVTWPATAVGIEYSTDTTFLGPGEVTFAPQSYSGGLSTGFRLLRASLYSWDTPVRPARQLPDAQWSDGDLTAHVVSLTPADWFFGDPSNPHSFGLPFTVYTNYNENDPLSTPPFDTIPVGSMTLTGRWSARAWVQPFTYRFLYAVRPPLRQFPRDDAVGGTPRQGHNSRSVQASTRQGWSDTYR